MRKMSLIMSMILIPLTLISCNNKSNNIRLSSKSDIHDISEISASENAKEKVYAEQKYDDVFQNTEFSVKGATIGSDFSLRSDYSLKSDIETGIEHLAILRIVPKNYEFYTQYGTLKAAIGEKNLRRKTEFAELECSSVEVIKKYGDFDFDVSDVAKLKLKQMVDIDFEEEYTEWFETEYGTKADDGYFFEDGSYYHSKEKLKKYGIKKLGTSNIPVLMYGKPYYVFASIDEPYNGQILFFPKACCEDDLTLVSTGADNIVMNPNQNPKILTDELIEMIKEIKQ